jgi:hypothetical protein
LDLDFPIAMGIGAGMGVLGFLWGKQLVMILWELLD